MRGRVQWRDHFLWESGRLKHPHNPHKYPENHHVAKSSDTYPDTTAKDKNTAIHDDIVGLEHVAPILDRSCFLDLTRTAYRSGANYLTTLIIAPANISVLNDVFSWFNLPLIAVGRS
jgi:hypothetical protein